jgi:hypothetical protein
MALVPSQPEGCFKSSLLQLLGSTRRVSVMAVIPTPLAQSQFL